METIPVEHRSNSPEETLDMAKRLARELKPGSVIYLQGELGAGKTLFAKGLARGLGINEDITSPSFSLLEIYATGRLPFYHFDLYRLNDPAELDNLFFEEYWDSDGVSVIEWPDKGLGKVPEPGWTITLHYLDENARKVTIERTDH